MVLCNIVRYDLSSRWNRSILDLALRMRFITQRPYERRCRLATRVLSIIRRILLIVYAWVIYLNRLGRRGILTLLLHHWPTVRIHGVI